MIVNVEINHDINKNEVGIVFHGKNLTSLSDIQNIASALIGGVCCFEATPLLSEDFEKFINSVNSKKTYCIFACNEGGNRGGFVQWSERL